MGFDTIEIDLVLALYYLGPYCVIELLTQLKTFSGQPGGRPKLKLTLNSGQLRLAWAWAELGKKAHEKNGNYLTFN